MLNKTKNKNVFIEEMHDMVNEFDGDPFDLIEDIEHKLAGVGELALKMDRDYCELCYLTRMIILDVYGTKEFDEEFKRRYPVGNLLTRVASHYSTKYLSEISDAAMKYASDAFIAKSEGAYDYFDAKGPGIFTFLVGRDGDVMTLLLEFGGEEDNAEQFTQGIAMIAAYGGSCIVRCDGSSEVFMFYGDEYTICPVPAHRLSGFLEHHQDTMPGYKGREMPLTTLNIPSVSGALS